MLKRLFIFILIQLLLSVNCVRADSFRGDFLSPKLAISNVMIKTIFDLPGMASITADTFLMNEKGSLTAAGIAQVEFAMVFHQLANNMIAITTELEYLEKVDIINLNDSDILSIVRISKKLSRVFYDIQDSFQFGSLTDRKSIERIIIQIKALNLEIPELMLIRKSEELKEELKPVAGAQLDCINFLNKRMQSLVYGIKERSFNLTELLEKDRTFGNTRVSENVHSLLFGYKDGLDFAIRNIRENIFVHGDPLMMTYGVNTRETADDIIIEFIDNGFGFDIAMLKEKAVELAFWSAEKAANAKDQQVIDLIFKKGFSRRYKKGEAHGLGLWLSKEIIEKYFLGSIHAENRKDSHGAKFTITIPKSAESARLKIKRIGLIDEIQRAKSGTIKTTLFSKGIAPSTFYSWKKRYVFNSLRDEELTEYRRRYQQIIIQEINLGFEKIDGVIESIRMKAVDTASEHEIALNDLFQKGLPSEKSNDIILEGFFGRNNIQRSAYFDFYQADNMLKEIENKARSLDSGKYLFGKLEYYQWLLRYLSFYFNTNLSQEGKTLAYLNDIILILNEHGINVKKTDEADDPSNKFMSPGRQRVFVDVYGKTLSVNRKSLESVRFAREDDVKAIANLSQRLYKQGFLDQKYILTENKLNNILKLKGNHLLLVSETEGSVSGFDYTSIQGYKAQCNQLVVSKEKEGNGYAKALSISRLMELEKRGVRYIESMPMHYKLRNMIEQFGLFTYKGELLYVMDMMDTIITTKESWDDILDIAQARVNVISHANALPEMVELPIVQAVRLSAQLKSRLSNSLNKWFRYQGEHDIVHRNRIGDYRTFLEWNSQELPDTLYFVLSFSPSEGIEIEGFLNTKFVGEDIEWVRAFMEIAPWNRGSDKLLRKYEGVGQELRTFGINKILRDDPLITHRATVSQLRALGNRDQDEDIFTNEITPESVQREVVRQIRKREKLIKKFGIIDMSGKRFFDPIDRSI